MNPQSSGQNGQPCNAPSFQWLSFAYQGLTEIPYEPILTQTDTLEVLDLSYNLLDEYPFSDQPGAINYSQWAAFVSHSFCLPRCPLPTSCMFVCSPSFCPYWNPALLGQLEKLSTLILDNNNYTSHIKFPYMPSVTTVCINKNKLNNLPVFVDEIRRKFPNIKWAWDHFVPLCRVCAYTMTSFTQCFLCSLLFIIGSWVWWTMKQHLVISMEEVWPSTKTTGEAQAPFTTNTAWITVRDHSWKFLCNNSTYSYSSNVNWLNIYQWKAFKKYNRGHLTAPGLHFFVF